AFRGRLMSLLVLTHYGVSSRPQLPQESPCISSAGIAFTTISYSSTSTKININHITSPGERRAVTTRKYKPNFFVRCKSCRSLPCPGTAITRPTENICGNSTCPKTPQDYSKEGRLKPFFANNVDIPFARARRLRPCPRKASARIDPGRQQQYSYLDINILFFRSL